MAFVTNVCDGDVMDNIEVIDQSFEIESEIDADKIYSKLERAARTCYQSYGKKGCSSDGSDCDESSCESHSAQKLLEKIIRLGHDAMLEHEDITVRFITNRGVSHELVRHRMASYAQESTRYVKYKDKIQIIRPCWFRATCEELNDDNPTQLWVDEMQWLNLMSQIGYVYNELCNTCGYSPQKARGVLPNDMKTEIVMTANIREWRHVFKLRCASAAHPQIRELMSPLCKTLQLNLPLLFKDIQIDS